MWLVLDKSLIDVNAVIEVFLKHCQYVKQPITHAMVCKKIV